MFAQPPNEPQYTHIHGEGIGYQCRIQAANEKYTNILCYDYRPTTFYKIIQISTQNTATNPTNSNSSTTTISTVFTHNIDSFRRNWANTHFIDEDRILVENEDPVEFDEAGNSTQRRYLSLFSMASGLLWDMDCSKYQIGGRITIPGHDLFAFSCQRGGPTVVVSLIDGTIQHTINTGRYTMYALIFYNVVDSMIAAKVTRSKYCVIDVLTGQINVYSFPIAGYVGCRFLFDRMVAWNNEEMQVVGFSPEPLRQ